MKTWWIDAKNHFHDLKDGSAEWATIPLMKFILLRTESGAIEAYCFTQKLEHRAAVYLALGHTELTKIAFIGGGTILRTAVCHAQFNSPSCLSAFGYDRPEDAKEQGDLLLELTRSVRTAGYGKE